MKTTLEIMRASPVIPVIAIDNPNTPCRWQALVAGGIRVLEVTLRTKHGLGAIKAMPSR
jgi:2-dehydro-3-deoxyphosphogluconate aldolase/(4S)-4-hydroxy-2-oxoglutarate aldolase